MPRLHSSRFIALALAGAMLLGVAACGSSGSDSSTGSSTAGGKADGTLPDKVRSAGQIVVATDATLPPVLFNDTDGTTVIGFVPEIVEAMAAKLDIKVKWQQTEFAGILTGVQAQRFDAGVIFADTKEREAGADFLSLYKEGRQFMVKSSYQAAEAWPNCGDKVGVQSGSVNEVELQKLSGENCTSKGKPAYKEVAFPSQAATTVALDAGRVDAVLTGGTTVAYNTSQHSTWKALGPQVDPRINAIGLPKSSKQLLEALKRAEQQIMDSGEYMKILRKWKLEDSASMPPKVNVGQS